MQPAKLPPPPSGEDDFKTTLAVARGLIRDLQVEGREDGKKIEDAARLVGVLKKNLRVRWELAGREEVLDV